MVDKKGRIEYLDFFRSFGILCMIVSHVYFGHLLDKWIHTFHMPMFFLISGYLYRNQNLRMMLKKRTRTLIVPYIIFGLMHCIISYLRNAQFDPHSLYILFFENTAEGGVPIAGALWFLSAIFISETLFCCLQQIIIPRLLKSVIAAIVTLLGMACATFLPFRLPWAFDVGMVGVGLFQLGYLIQEKWHKILDLRLVYSLMGVAFFSMLGIISPYINLREGNYGIWLMFLINAFGMTICLWNLSRHIYKRAGQNHTLKKTMSWINSIGRDSIIYLCLNQLSILIAGDLVNHMISANGFAIELMKKIIILIISLSELAILQRIIIGTKLKIIVGK